mmetsp:Transcript_32162/g.48577  ORF Transcript_32162/g.48577 Transcript_32162/m.48577 type:complete len:87 (-) Transcript_32162:862-1122(-)
MEQSDEFTKPCEAEKNIQEQTATATPDSECESDVEEDCIRGTSVYYVANLLSSNFLCGCLFLLPMEITFPQTQTHTTPRDAHRICG